MPLVKEVCKLCLCNAYEDVEGWTRWDEVRWEENRVLCPGKSGWHSIFGDAPSGCIMVLEQGVLSQNLGLNQEQVKPWR